MMNPAWLFAALWLLLPGGFLLFRVLVVSSRSFPWLHLLRVLGIVSAVMLAAGLALAEQPVGPNPPPGPGPNPDPSVSPVPAYYGGRCYSTPAEAAKAWCLDQPGAVVSGGPAAFIPNSTSYSVFYGAVSQLVNSCSVYPDGTGAVIQYSMPVNGRWQNFSSTYSLLGDSGARTTSIGNMSHTRLLSFPSCEVTPPTSDDILYVYSWGAGSVLTLFALGLAVGAARRVIRKA